MIFPFKKIAELAQNRRTYLKGVEIYNAGKVHNPIILDDILGIYDQICHVDVNSQQSDAIYEVEYAIGHSGELESYSCTCPDSNTHGDICKHIVAALTQKYYSDMGTVSEIPPLAKTMGKMPTDASAHLMISRYVDLQTVEIVTQKGNTQDKVELIPIIRLNQYNAQLEFTIGNKRQYVIKDITEFYNNMKSNKPAGYGKNLEFIHHQSNFTDKSQPILEFVLSRIGDLVSGISVQRQGQYKNLPTRYLDLNPSSLDRFFELFENKSLLYKSDYSFSNPYEIELVNASQPIHASIVESKQKGGFDIHCDIELSILGKNHLYIMEDRKFLKCTTQCTKSILPFVEAINQGDGEMYISEKDMPDFFNGVYNKISKYIEFSGDTDMLENFEAESLEVEIYLDIDESERITASVIFIYGEEKIEPYNKFKTYNVKRNQLEELGIKLILQKYFTGYLIAENLLFFDGDDDSIYNFVVNAIKELNEVAKVFATDKLKRVNVIAPPKISIGVSLSNNLLNLDFDTGGFDPVELMQILDSYKQKKNYHRLVDGSFLEFADNSFSSLFNLSDGLYLTEKQIAEGNAVLPQYRAMYLDKFLSDGQDIDFHRDDHYKNLVKNMKSVPDSDYKVPDSLNSILRNYQKTGFRWLKTLSHYGFSGILADDMGLGKTLQIIALMLDEKQHNSDTISLVVCPTSLVLNWENEFKRFAPELDIIAIASDAATRKDSIEALKRGEYTVGITSYDLLKRDREHYENIVFKYHILDEAQYIKNHSTQNARTVKAIDSIHRFALTGTPIENRLSELWSIFDFLMPGYLYSYKKFKDDFEFPIVKDKDEVANSNLSRMITPFIIRRLKKDVLKELPAKTESVIFTNMEEEQEKIYLANAMKIKDDLQLSIKNNDFGRNKIAVLAMLTRLRQICCDPSLCYDNYIHGSAKLDSCIELITEAISAGHKVLLFSQFTSMLAIIEKRLKSENVSFFTLQGSTPRDRRISMVDKFNSDDTSVFLISLKAGGTGLNLTGADIVIHFDPWWNMAAQNQATDRAYRIGQKNAVQVYKLIAKNTIEEKILALQRTKMDLSDSVIKEDGGIINNMSANDLMDILM